MDRDDADGKATKSRAKLDTGYKSNGAPKSKITTLLVFVESGPRDDEQISKFGYRIALLIAKPVQDLANTEMDKRSGIKWPKLSEELFA